ASRVRSVRGWGQYFRVLPSSRIAHSRPTRLHGYVRGNPPGSFEDEAAGAAEHFTAVLVLNLHDVLQVVTTVLALHYVTSLARFLYPGARPTRQIIGSPGSASGLYQLCLVR